MAIEIPRAWACLSPPQLFVLETLRERGPLRIANRRGACIFYRGMIHTVWSVRVSLEQRKLIRRRSDGKYALESTHGRS